MKPVRICYVIAGLDVGGAEMSLLRLILSQSDSLYHHTVVVLTPGGKLLPRFEAAKIEVVELSFARSPTRSFLKLIRILQGLRPDLVHTWLYHADLIGGIAAKLAGVGPVVWCVHSTNFQSSRWDRTLLLRRLCALVSRWIPRAIVFVAQSARALHVRLGYKARLMMVIPNGFVVRPVPPSPETARLRSLYGTAGVIGWVGRYNPDKDIGCFLDALRLLANGGTHFTAVMVGSGLEGTNVELAALIKTRSLGDRIHLLGLRADVTSCLASFDIFCLSSRSEAFPLVLGEAMAASLPCVATDVGDVGYLLGDAGRIVPPRDAAALAEGLRGMLGLQETARREIGERAAARIRTHFSMESTGLQYSRMYEEVLAPG